MVILKFEARRFPWRSCMQNKSRQKRGQSLGKLVISMEIIIDEASSRHSNHKNKGELKCQIRKVPLLLRNHENLKGVFDPKVVSLGPYHHGKLELQFVENLKPMVARQFVLDSANDKNIDEFYNKVLEKVDDARSCYVDNSTDQYSDSEFANMMLLDGCFILAMIESFAILGGESKYDDVIAHLGMLVWHSTVTDIFYLLENQVPFQVLELLTSLKFEDDEGMIMIHAFLDYKISGDLQILIKKEVKIREIEKQSFHLLQLLRTKYILPDQQLHPILNLKSHSQRGAKKDKFQSNRLKDYISNSFRFVKKEKNSRHKHNLKDYIHSFRSVTELKAKGIYFRPTSSRSLNAIKFKSYCFYGWLELPPILVTTNSKILFSNVIAYELCSYTREDLGITTYLNFLKSLIDNPDDVKELRSKRILFNSLGSDEQVVNVFKEITILGVENIEMYDEVKQSIQDHYNSIAKTWMAEFIHKYFSSPWTIIAFVATTSLLVLAFLQTYFTISPPHHKARKHTKFHY